MKSGTVRDVWLLNGAYQTAEKSYKKKIRHENFTHFFQLTNAGMQSSTIYAQQPRLKRIISFD
jgi:hypothetical protein